jgi:hypothetical protein
MRRTSRRWWRLAMLGLFVLVAACAPSPSPTTSVPVSPAEATIAASPTLLTRDQAIGLARAAAAQSSPSRGSGEEVLVAELRRYGDLDAYVAPGATPPASDEQLVWAVNLGTPGPMGQGVIVILDAIDGHVLHLTEWIA